ncbi:uncharacterized protein LOC128680342 isoform X2 [Plodia interpunctella]|uniref:uncharacterized protein LOC128680342 isoform X2 n=1 Tax=Plodia interpunctella TaxID=58824 RepID=UPI00236762BE|nr:uncharacterized protein LOC128680342 isoform X2 [Plodia interpunctella]
MPSATQRSVSEALDVIKEEQGSHHSSVNINNVKSECEECVCTQLPSVSAAQAPPPEDMVKMAEVEKMLKEKDATLRKQYEQDLKDQISLLKERFDFILQNEQIRTSYMLREAHRERQEKIVALQSQLECKNMAGLMYVMCSERRRGKLEKLRIIEEYTGYIRELQSILTDGQQLILNLSRGYKTATRVDHEWREKMKKIIKEFQAYVVNYNGGTAETNQYIFDLPGLLKTEAPLQDNPKEDPCEAEEEEAPFVDEEVPWWEQLQSECRPFIMFGDLAEFTPPQRRETLKAVKAPKTAPKKWKHYMFNEMYLRSDCSNLDAIKDEQPLRFPLQNYWECAAVQALDRNESAVRSKYNFSTHRLTSVDARGNMGSILKIMTSGPHTSEPVTKANLLGARDSMEITSTTRLYDGVDKGLKSEVLRKKSECQETMAKIPKAPESKAEDDDDDSGSHSLLGSVNDSLHVMATHKPDQDHKIHYEKVCPMDKCKRMQMDSFTSSLPPYMRANPFMHFEQTFEDYETCTPDQLVMLKQRMELKKKKHKSQAAMVVEEPSILEEWGPEIEGVSCQTSEIKLFLPPCTCELPMSSDTTLSGGGVFRIEDLLPIKKALDDIQQKCFFDDEIEFNRFAVVGHDSDASIPATQEAFDKKRVTEIHRILKKHPSLCDLFQANTS